MKWRFEYQPADDGETDKVRWFEGYRWEMDEWFGNNLLCDTCKQEWKQGYIEMLDSDGTKHGTFPIDSPWQTGCGCEWDVEEWLE